MKPHWTDYEVEVVHCGGVGSVGGGDFTLCGDSLNGINDDTPMKATKDRITCDRCLAIIEFCKGVRAKELLR
jgi:hypothetical protein